MESSDVRSIESLRLLRNAVGELSNDWTIALQQIKSSMHRTQEHFLTIMPAYWKQQTRIAEQKLAEAQDNLSRQHGTSASGQAPAVTEAKQRVQAAKRRLNLCEEKFRLASKIAIQFDYACQELAGPIAEVVAHASVTLPNAAGDLAVLTGHLDRYAERIRFDDLTPEMNLTPRPQKPPIPPPPDELDKPESLHKRRGTDHEPSH